MYVSPRPRACKHGQRKPRGATLPGAFIPDTAVGPSANEIAIYAVETKAIIHVLWGLLMIASITIVSLAIMVASLKFTVRSARRREAQHARQVAAHAAERQV